MRSLKNVLHSTLENTDMTIQSMALIGTGVMGMGIAQIAAQAGLEVRLFDAKAGAAEAGLAKLAEARLKSCRPKVNLLKKF